MWIFKKPFLNYGCLGFALATLTLPLYIFIPKFYADNFGLSLSVLGILVLSTRMLDAIQDPFLGYLSERLSLKGVDRTRIILWVTPVLIVSVIGLFTPLPVFSAYIWFTLFMVLVYSFYSLLTINYYALAPILAPGYEDQTRLTASREGWGLMGVTFASVMITVMLAYLDEKSAFFYFSLGLGLILLILSLFSMGSVRDYMVSRPVPAGDLMGWLTLLKNKKFSRLCAGYFLSNIASSFPAAFFLFYLEEVIQAEALSGLFLGLYFLSGAFSMPFWSAIANAIGKKNAWVFSMMLAVLAFVWAGFLREGDEFAYGIICILSGYALGADLSIPPSLLSDALGGQGNTRAFGLWTMLTKMTIAIGGGLAFFAIDFGRSAFWQEQGYSLAASIAFLYALLPCVLKLLAGIYVYFYVLDERYPQR